MLTWLKIAGCHPRSWKPVGRPWRPRGVSTLVGASGQKGQSIVIGAFAMTAMIGVAGLAVDGGRMNVNRRSLQGSADAAADSAMRMILQDYHDAANAQTQTLTAFFIHDQG